MSSFFQARSEDIKGTASVASPLHTGGQRRHRYSVRLIFITYQQSPVLNLINLQQSASPHTNIPAARVPSSGPWSLQRTSGAAALAHSARKTLVFGQVQ